MPGADQHDGDEGERQAEQPGRAQPLALHQTHADRERGGHQRGDRGQHVHRADGQGLVEERERHRRGDTGGGTPAHDARAERRAEHGPQQQLDREAGRGGDHHGAQHVRLSGTEAAEEVGAAIGE